MFVLYVDSSTQRHRWPKRKGSLSLSGRWVIAMSRWETRSGEVGYLGEGRRAGRPEQSESPQRFGGVSVDSTSRNIGVSQGAKPSVDAAGELQAKAQLRRTQEAAASGGGLGVPGEGTAPPLPAAVQDAQRWHSSQCAEPKRRQQGWPGKPDSNFTTRQGNL